MRPQTLSQFIGQEHLVGKNKIIYNAISNKNLFSMIFWGPPGVGKTTLAYIIAKSTNAQFHALSGVASGKKDLMEIITLAKERVKKGKKTLIFIDEIHRWNKAQQDVLLPYVESNIVTLIGATTENPSFEVISPLLSRSKVFLLKPITNENLVELINQALTDKVNGLGKHNKKLSKKAEGLLVELSGGDARVALNALELAITGYKEKQITPSTILEIFQNKSSKLYDKAGEEHYNTISAYIKSMRASNVDAALHYLARMVEAGEDPLFIARRMVIFASEDVGMGQPTALVVANEVFRACETIGYPECQINLAHGTVYLALAKKNRNAYNAYFMALNDVKTLGNLPIPLELRNAPTKYMKKIGYGKGYEMYPDKSKSLFPEKLKNKKYYSEK
jgi:putative ATPase